MKIAIRPRGGRECRRSGAYTFGRSKSRCFLDSGYEKFSISWGISELWTLKFSSDLIWRDPFISVCWRRNFCFSVGH